MAKKSSIIDVQMAAMTEYVIFKDLAIGTFFTTDKASEACSLKYCVKVAEELYLEYVYSGGGYTATARTCHYKMQVIILRAKLELSQQ